MVGNFAFLQWLTFYLEFSPCAQVEPCLRVSETETFVLNYIDHIVNRLCT